MTADRFDSLSRREFVGAGAAAALAPIMLRQLIADAGAAVEPPPLGNLPSTVQLPSIGELERIARMHSMDLSRQELEEYRKLIAGFLGSFRRLDQFAEPRLPVKYPRDGGFRPAPSDNPHNAWYWKCTIKGAPSGKLAGKTVAIKDNTCVAGVPMMNGANVLEGFIPDQDATIVTRILDAGGTILGKAVCEHFCFSGSSYISDTGPVLNPHNPKRSAGGSSSGSGALVAGGVVDLATGGDQGGSIRIPAAWSGCVGLKPSYGLVPYTGIFPIELTVDHTGPMARTVEDCALLLEVLAGPDGLDPRQYRGQLKGQAYTKALTGDAKGLRIGLVKEGFGWEGASQPEVDSLVRQSALRLKELGAEVGDVSIPMHREAGHIAFGIYADGALSLMIHGDGMGTNWQGHYLTQLQDFFGRSRRTRANDFSETVKVLILLGQYLHDNYHGRYYAKAQNISRLLVEAYDEVFQAADVLVMPTTPMVATELPPPDAGISETVGHVWGMLQNTTAANVTGHPALSVPCGFSQGLPVGMMMIGRYGEDAVVLRAAHAVERLAKQG
jgi:amidase